MYSLVLTSVYLLSLQSYSSYPTAHGIVLYIEGSSSALSETPVSP